MPLSVDVLDWLSFYFLNLECGMSGHRIHMITRRDMSACRPPISKAVPGTLQKVFQCCSGVIISSFSSFSVFVEYG